MKSRDVISIPKCNQHFHVSSDRNLKEIKNLVPRSWQRFKPGTFQMQCKCFNTNTFYVMGTQYA